MSDRIRYKKSIHWMLGGWNGSTKGLEMTGLETEKSMQDCQATSDCLVVLQY